MRQHNCIACRQLQFIYTKKKMQNKKMKYTYKIYKKRNKKKNEKSSQHKKRRQPAAIRMRHKQPHIYYMLGTTVQYIIFDARLRN